MGQLLSWSLRRPLCWTFIYAAPQADPGQETAPSPLAQDYRIRVSVEVVAQTGINGSTSTSPGGRTDPAEARSLRLRPSLRSGEAPCLTGRARLVLREVSEASTSVSAFDGGGFGVPEKRTNTPRP